MSLQQLKQDYQNVAREIGLDSEDNVMIVLSHTMYKKNPLKQTNTGLQQNMIASHSWRNLSLLSLRLDFATSCIWARIVNREDSLGSLQFE